MKTNLCIALGSAAVFSCVSLQAQPYGAEDPLMGVYEGTWTSLDGRGTVLSQIRSRGDGAYDGFVLLKQGATNFTVLKIATEQKASTEEDRGVRFRGSALSLKSDSSRRGEATAEIARRGKTISLSGRFAGELGSGEFQAVKVVKKSPTLGAKPPPGALLAFDGKQTNKWQNFHFQLMGDGSMQVRKGDLNTAEKLDDFKLHVEFRTPFMPKSEGQARGNSGVYLQSLYEVQVLDSFGLYPLQNNDCGSIYGIKAPEGNACLPPMDWQTYDITYENGDGTAVRPPTVTVLHNGVLTIDRIKIPADKIGRGTTSAQPGGGFLMLQDHGNPVQYRNIWALPLEKHGATL